jgi:hypothetical protein
MKIAEPPVHAAQLLRLLLLLVVVLVLVLVLVLVERRCGAELLVVGELRLSAGWLAVGVGRPMGAQFRTFGDGDSEVVRGLTLWC